MSRKKAGNGGGGKFKRLLGWTVLIAIVFSAGLITGERLVRKKNLSPLVSVTDQVATAPAEDAGDRESDAADEGPTFSFFDQLTRGDSVALASKQKPADEPETKPAPKEPKPEADAADEQPASEQGADEQGADKQVAAKQAADKKPAEQQQAEQQAEPAPEAADEPSDESQADRYTLQVAAHPDMDSAKSHMERLRKMGLEPHLVSAEVPGRGEFYRVRVGKFGSMDEARSFQDDLERKNSLSTFVSPL